MQVAVLRLWWPTEQVPEHAWHVTPVHLLATAGLRLLSEQDASDILVECAAVLASSHFAFQVRTASGNLPAVVIAQRIRALSTMGWEQPTVHKHAHHGQDARLRGRVATSESHLHCVHVETPRICALGLRVALADLLLLLTALFNTVGGNVIVTLEPVDTGKLGAHH